MKSQQPGRTWGKPSVHNEQSCVISKALHEKTHALGTFMSYIIEGSVFSGYKTPNTFKNDVLEKVMTMSGNEVKIRNVKVIKHYP